jgi:hypothetical protein
MAKIHIGKRNYDVVDERIEHDSEENQKRRNDEDGNKDVSVSFVQGVVVTDYR